MGKGDIKSAKGKRTNGSYGNSRKRKSTAKVVVSKKSEEKVVLEKAFLASEALTDDDRSLAVSGVLDDVFERLNIQILPFINSIEELP